MQTTTFETANTFSEPEIINIRIRGVYDDGLYEIPRAHLLAMTTLHEYPEHAVVQRQLNTLLDAPEGEYFGEYAVVELALASWANAILTSRWEETPWRMTQKSARLLLAGMKHQADQIKRAGGNNQAEKLREIARTISLAFSIPPAKEKALFEQGFTVHEIVALYALDVATNMANEMDRLKLTTFGPAEPPPLELLNAAKKVVAQGVAHTMTFRKQQANVATT